MFSFSNIFFYQRSAFRWEGAWRGRNWRENKLVGGRWGESSAGAHCLEGKERGIAGFVQCLSLICLKNIPFVEDFNSKFGLDIF